MYSVYNKAKVKFMLRYNEIDGAEAWTLTKKEEHALLIFERKYLEKYMVLNMKPGNGKVGRIEN